MDNFPSRRGSLCVPKASQAKVKNKDLTPNTQIQNKDLTPNTVQDEERAGEEEREDGEGNPADSEAASGSGC
jgi:hypothetical protein